jgi:hypothetical protein
MFLRLTLIAAALGTMAPNVPDTRLAKAEKIVIEESTDISGYYTCKGTEPGGKNYSGVAVITKQNQVYTVQWIVGSGSSFAGIGIRQANNFSASWAIATEKGLIRGVNTYKIEPGPRLVGRWATLPGVGVMHNETLTFLKNVEVEEDSD